METYHNLYTSLLNTGSEYARKTLAITIAGIDVGNLVKYTNTNYGIESWSINLSSEGYQSTISWQNKPITYPSSELSLRALKPTFMNSI